MRILFSFFIVYNFFTSCNCGPFNDDLIIPNVRGTNEKCEPNQVICDNGKCIPRMWICDGEDDCGDKSDEKDCGTKSPNDQCQPYEFKCDRENQCVKKSYHCDGQNDCMDGSDEFGCTGPTAVQPPANLSACMNGVITLTCRTVGVPVPYINWRLNWGPVCSAPRCTQTSVNGYSVLTIQDASFLDQGAYTCEAVNVKKRILVTPDAIVTVTKCNVDADPGPPTPPINNCNQFGTLSKQPDGSCKCKEYTTGDKCDMCKPHSYWLNGRSPGGCIPCFCSGVTKECDSTRLYRQTETITNFKSWNNIRVRTSEQTNPFTSAYFARGNGELVFDGFDDAPYGRALYLEVSQSFLGNRITGYGGNLKFTFRYSGDGADDQSFSAIIRGNNIALQSIARTTATPNQESTITIPLYEDAWQRDDLRTSTREHLLMTLANLSSILIKVSWKEKMKSFSLISISIDYASADNSSQGIAYPVEEGRCPAGYIGTSCENCASGYVRTGGGLYLGLCERCFCHGHSDQCDPEFGECRNCQHNTMGPHCDKCKPGYTGDAKQGTASDCRKSVGKLQETVIAGCPEKNLTVGDKLHLRCALAELQPSVSFRWVRIGGSTMNINAKTPSTGELLIKSVTADDSGTYECQAYNAHTNEIVASGRVTVIVQSENGFVELSVVISKPLFYVGEDAAFKCQVKGDDSAKINWERDGAPMPINSVINGNLLTIKQVTEGDSGTYKCFASTKIGDIAAEGILEVLALQSWYRADRLVKRIRRRRRRNNVKKVRF